MRRTVMVGRWRRRWPKRLLLCAGSVPIGVRASCAQCRAPRGGVACGQQDGRSAACGRAVSFRRRRRRRVAAPGRPFRAVMCGASTSRAPHPRRRTLRPADRQRRPQPFPSGLRHRPVRVAVERSSSATACLWPPLGQRGTVRRNGRGQTVSSARLDQGRHRVGAHRAGQPQQNGRHERMHRTLKAETAKPPAASASSRSASTATNDNRHPRALWPAAASGVSTGPRCGLTPNAWTSPGRCLARHGRVRRVHPPWSSSARR